MPAYSVSPRAADDLDEILSFTIERWGYGQATEYFGGLEALFDLLSSRPMMGRMAPSIRPDMRRMEYKSHIIFYRQRDAGICVERVLHKSRALKKSEF
jgi:toxin ParE1/3/4